MSETGDLVRLMGELDRLLVDVAARAPRAAEAARDAAAMLVPPLRAVDVGTGWYDEFLDAARADDLSVAPSVPRASAADRPAPPGRAPAGDDDTGEPVATAADVQPVVAALADMAQLPRGTELSVVPAHRVAVVGAVVRALDALGVDARVRPIATGALAVNGVVPEPEGRAFDDDRTGGRDERAGALIELVAAAPDLEALNRAFTDAGNADIVDVRLRAAAAACSTRVVPIVTRTGTATALAVRTDICVAGLAFDDAVGPDGLVNPQNWVRSPYWCAMQGADYDANTWARPCHFFEHVAIDCDEQSPLLPVKTWLHFTRLLASGSAAGRRIAFREYGMVPTEQAPDLAGHHENGAVTVDEGCFVVRDEGDHLQVTSTKRVVFTRGVTEEALAVLACAVGYGDLSTAFVHDVLERLGGAITTVACEPLARGARPFGDRGTGTYDPLDVPLAELEDVVGECADEAGESFARLVAGDYTSERLAEDIARSVGRSAAALGKLGEVVTVLADPPSTLGDVDSGSFALPSTSGTAVAPEDLRVEGPLRSLRGFRMPSARVRCVPDQDGARGAFRLHVHAAGLPAGIYRGWVTTRRRGPVPRPRVPVHVVVP